MVEQFPTRILIIQLKRAGDVILTTPVLSVLKERMPHLCIDFLVDKALAPILEGNPHIHRIHLYDRDHPLRQIQMIHAEHFEGILDFQSSPRTAMIAACSGAKLRAGYQVPFWGSFYNHAVRRSRGSVYAVNGKMSLIQTWVELPVDPPPIHLYLTAQERSWAETLAPKPAKRVGIIPTHRRASRKWPGEYFVETAEEFLAKGFEVWFFWGPGEENEVRSLHRRVPGSRMAPATTLREMAALLSCCSVVISNDNGPRHMAIAVGVPTVAIFGPTDPFCWTPRHPLHKALVADGISCLGCNLNQCPFGHECMRFIQPERVVQESEALLRNVAGVVSV